MSEPASALELARTKFAPVVGEKGLLDSAVAVSVSPLTAEEAIGRPTRRDFPIIEGKEQLVEAAVNGAKGHAFTDSPRGFSGTISDVLALPLASNRNRAVFAAVLNATLRSLGILESSLHCRDEDPERCAVDLARYVRDQWGEGSVGLIGLNPAIAEALVASFGVANVRITDLNRKNIGTEKSRVPVWDGRTQTEKLVCESHVVLITGTTLVNGSFDDISAWIREYKRNHLIYGVTAAGVCELMNWNRFCPYARGM